MARAQLYDALLKDYEPDGSMDEISKMFEALQPIGRVALAVLSARLRLNWRDNLMQLQLKLSQELAECLAITWRLDNR